MVDGKPYFRKIITGFLGAFLTIFAISPAYALEMDQKGKIPPFALLTVPKSGSHMIIKALHLLTGGISVWHTRFPSFHYIPIEEGFLYTHLCISPQLESDYSALPKLKKIINIRDIRDVCVSIVHQIQKSPWPGMNAQQREAFLKSTFDEQLLFVIDFDYDVNEVSSAAPNSLQVSVLKLAEQAERFARESNNLVCKYENLVGMMGGGSEKDQIEELRRIAEFLEIPISEAALYEISWQLYGDEVNPFGKEGFKNYHSTFHNGKIGAWKTAFKTEHKIAFKKKLGKMLISLGYESDDDW